MHTIAHIHEMKAEVQDGLEFMQRSETHWKVRFSSVHLPGKFCLFPQVKPGINGWSYKAWLSSGENSSSTWRHFCQATESPGDPMASQHLLMF